MKDKSHSTNKCGKRRSKSNLHIVMTAMVEVDFLLLTFFVPEMMIHQHTKICDRTF